MAALLGRLRRGRAPRLARYRVDSLRRPASALAADSADFLRRNRRVFFLSHDHGPGSRGDPSRAAFVSQTAGDSRPARRLCRGFSGLLRRFGQLFLLSVHSHRGADAADRVRHHDRARRVQRASAARRRRSENSRPHARPSGARDVAAVFPVPSSAGAAVGNAAGRLQRRDRAVGDHVARFDQRPVPVGCDRIQSEIRNGAAAARPALLARPGAVGFRRPRLARGPAPAAPEHERRGRRHAGRLRSDPRASQPQLDVRAGNAGAHPAGRAPHLRVPGDLPDADS